MVLLLSWVIEIQVEYGIINEIIKLVSGDDQFL